MRKAELQPKSFRTDEISQFIGALEFAAELASSVKVDISRSRWLIIALHNAVQGVCVCALRGADSTGISVLEKKSGAAMWQWLDIDSRNKNHGPPPPERLATMLVLYKRVKNPIYLQVPLPLCAVRDRGIQRLNDLRNEFIHFVPKRWSIEWSGLPSIVQSSCETVQHLAIEHPTFGHHFGGHERVRIQTATLALRNAFSN